MWASRASERAGIALLKSTYNSNRFKSHPLPPLPETSPILLNPGTNHSLASVEYLEAEFRPYLGKRACQLYRKKNLVPGLLKGVGPGHFDVPIAVRLADLASFRDRGTFTGREYKMVCVLSRKRICLQKVNFIFLCVRS